MMGKEIQFHFTLDDSTILSRMDNWDIYIGVIGKFQIFINKKIFFEEECFNIVEFGVLAKRWVKTDKPNFAYKSLEFEGVLFEFQCEKDGVLIISRFSYFEISELFAYSTLLDALEEYFSQVEKCLAKHGYEFQKLVDDVRLDSR